MNAAWIILTAVVHLGGHPLWPICPARLADCPQQPADYAEQPGEPMPLSPDAVRWRPDAPNVVVLPAQGAPFPAPGWAATADLPALQTVFQRQSLTIDVSLLVPDETMVVEQVLLLLDREPLENNCQAPTPLANLLLESGDTQFAFRFTIPCPPLGRHIVQARYKVYGVWSLISPPVHFEVRPPQRPQIVAIAQDGSLLHPLPGYALVELSQGHARFQLAHVQPDDVVEVALDGKFVGMASKKNCPGTCTWEVCLANLVPPGTYALTVRRASKGTVCDISSESSEAVYVRLPTEDVYVLKPGGNYCSPCAAAPAKKPAEVLGEQPAATEPMPSLDIEFVRPDSLPDRPQPERGAEVFPRRRVIQSVAYQDEPDAVAQPAPSTSTVQQASATATQAAAAATEAKDVAALAARIAAESNALAQETTDDYEEAKKDMDIAYASIKLIRQAGHHPEGVDAERAFALLINAARDLGREQEQADSHLRSARDAAEDAARLARIAAAHQAEAENAMALAQAAKQAGPVTATVLLNQATRTAAVASASRDSALAQAATAMKARTAIEAHRIAAGELRSQIQTYVDVLKNMKPPKPAQPPIAPPQSAILDLRIGNANRELQDRHDLAQSEAEIVRAGELQTALRGGAVDLLLPKKAEPLRRTFDFASAAHFPLREFGPRGEVYDRHGAVIYEDMKFTFDENGDYSIEGRFGLPGMPATLHLQFLVQARDRGPWYTVTLEPIYFKAAGGGQRSVESKSIIGHSEILHRCFTTICRVRREGSAQFGFGFDVLSRAGRY